MQNPRGLMRLFIFYGGENMSAAAAVQCGACFDSWMDSQHQYSHAKKLSYNPGSGETSQLFFLACCRTS